MRLLRWTAVGALGVSLACAAPVKHAAVGRLTIPPEVQVGRIERGTCAGCETHPDVAACSDFTLTEDEVRTVLSRSTEITPQQLTQYFQWAPCVVRGRASWRGGAASYEISAFLVTSLRLDDGSTRMLGCDGACEAAVYRTAPR